MLRNIGKKSVQVEIVEIPDFLDEIRRVQDGMAVDKIPDFLKSENNFHKINLKLS